MLFLSLPVNIFSASLSLSHPFAFSTKWSTARLLLLTWLMNALRIAFIYEFHQRDNNKREVKKKKYQLNFIQTAIFVEQLTRWFFFAVRRAIAICVSPASITDSLGAAARLLPFVQAKRTMHDAMHP